MRAEAIVLVAAAAFPTVATAASCSGGGQTPGAAAATSATGATGASQSASSSSGAGGMLPSCSATADAALTCKAPEACGVPATMMQVAAPLPAGKGGTIADGVYLLTAYNVYTGVGGAEGPTNFKVEQVLVIQGGKSVRWRLGAQGPAQGFAGTLDTSKGFFNLSTTCPGALAGKDEPYSAAGDTLRVYGSKNSDERVFNRRGP